MKVDLQLDEWADINSDLLEEIIQRVEFYGDYVRFRAVCKTWNLELPKIPRYIKFPLLVLPFDDERDIVRQFYHFGEKKVIHRLEIPETKNVFFRGSCYGWLISVRLDGALQMLEPFTKAQIDLPPLAAFSEIIDYQPDRDEEYTLRDYIDRLGATYTFDKFHMQKFYIQKIVLSSPPNDDDQDFMAIAIYGQFRRLAFYTRNNKTWTDFKTPKVKSYFCDVIFHEGKIYAIDDEYGACRIFEFDIKTKVGEMSSAPPFNYDSDEPHIHCVYLVGTVDGLLLVLRYFKACPKDCNDMCYVTCGFSVYKLTQSGWIEVKSLGDYVLVIGSNSSVCILPHTILHNKGNRIYYSDDYYDLHYEQIIGGHDNGVFDLEDGIVHSLILDKHLIIPAPIWLLPNEKF